MRPGTGCAVLAHVSDLLIDGGTGGTWPASIFLPEQFGMSGRAEPALACEIEVTAVAHFTYQDVFRNSDDALVLIVEKQIDTQRSAQFALRLQRRSDHQFVERDAPHRQLGLGGMGTSRVAVSEDDDPVPRGAESGRQDSEKLRMFRDSSVEGDFHSHRSSLA